MKPLNLPALSGTWLSHELDTNVSGFPLLSLGNRVQVLSAEVIGRLVVGILFESNFLGPESVMEVGEKPLK